MKKLTIENLINSHHLPGAVNKGNDFCLIDYRYSRDLDSFMSQPFSFDGVMSIFCISGKVKVMVNLKEFIIEQNMLFVNVSNNILNVTQYCDSETDSPRFLVVAISRQYMSAMNIDLNRLFLDGVSVLDNPTVTLDDNEKEIALSYLQLMNKIITYTSPYQNDCLANLVSSICYLISSMREKKLQEVIVEGDLVASRKRNTASRFLKLVSEHHMSERSVGFYAEKLCLTPKYLSKLVKSATGRSAPEWIDEFVIVEAKNMLRYSDMQIKEIVFRLNFPNQSVFHKYFKSHVGLTPGEFRERK